MEVRTGVAWVDVVYNNLWEDTCVRREPQVGRERAVNTANPPLVTPKGEPPPSELDRSVVRGPRAFEPTNDLPRPWQHHGRQHQLDRIAPNEGV